MKKIRVIHGTDTHQVYYLGKIYKFENREILLEDDIADMLLKSKNYSEVLEFIKEV